MNSELLQMLKELNVYNSIDNLFSPDHQQLCQIYEKFCRNINFNDSCSLENPLLNLFYRCKVMSKAVGIPDFQIQDLIDPEPKRMRHILGQVCKYCFWQREQQNRWENKLREISNLEEKELAERKAQKKSIEDYIQFATHDLESRKEQSEQLKKRRQELHVEIAAKQQLKQKLSLSLKSDHQELEDIRQRIENLRQKLELLKNELMMLEGQIVKEPKRLEQKLKETTARFQSLEQDLERLGRERKLEEFKLSIYRQFGDCCEQLNQELQKQRGLEQQMRELSDQINESREHGVRLNATIGSLQLSISKLQAECQSLVDQKKAQESSENSQQYQSLVQLQDLQNQLLEAEGQLKREREHLGKLKSEKVQLEMQLGEAERDRENIENNASLITKQQRNEVLEFTESIIQLLSHLTL